MKIFIVIYPIRKNEHNKLIFKPEFVRKNKFKCKISYNNKLYPLVNVFKIQNVNITRLKLKLICYDNSIDLSKIFKGYGVFYKFYETRKYDLKNSERKEKIKCLYHEMSKMVYNINPNDKFIQILSNEFVERNKDKCLLIYNNDIFPLKGSFYGQEIKKGENKLEIYMIELKEIYDRSHMFSLCFTLEEYSLFEREQKE